MKFIKSYSVTFFTDFLRLQGFQSEESQGVNPPVQLCGGRGWVGGGRAVAERGRGHQGARQAGRGERPEQAGVVGDLRAGPVGWETG